MTERLWDARQRCSLYAFVGILFLAIGWGLFVRFNGLGFRPLAEDEYFSVTAVQYILEKGVPEFPTGGYYVRGLPLQYLQAAVVRLFGDNEFSHRLPAALFGVLTLLLVFLCARIFLPWPLAATCAAMLAVSAWQIEFGRFSRMYAAFQFFTLAFFLAYHRAYFRGTDKLRYLPHALALMAVLCHTLGVTLLPLLFLPLLIEQNARHGATPPRHRKTFAIVSLATLVAGAAYAGLAWRLREFHVQQNLPDGFHVPPSDSLGPLRAYTVLPIPRNVLGGFFLITLVAAAFMYYRARSKTTPGTAFPIVDVSLLLLLFSALLHLFAVSVCIGAVLFIRYHLHRTLLNDRSRLALLILSGLIACAWVFYAIYDQSWREQMLTTNFPRSLRIVFFGWPDFYDPTIWPWIHSLPFLTAIFLMALAWHFIQLGDQSLTSILEHPIIIIIAAFGSIAVVDPILQPVPRTTRYFYHVYPFVILLIVMACYQVVCKTTGRWRAIGSKTQVLLSGFLAMGLFVLSEDFSLWQLLHINSPEVTFRTGEFERFQSHWFWRFDVRSPAEFLNAHRDQVDALVVSIYARPLPHYLHSDVDFAYYCSREGQDASRYSREGQDAWRYSDISRSKGKLDLWTARPLLGTERELRAYTKRIRAMYLVRRVAPGPHDFEINHVWPDRLVTFERAYLSSDGNIEVVKISLNQATEKDPTCLGPRRTTCNYAAYDPPSIFHHSGDGLSARGLNSESGPGLRGMNVPLRNEEANVARLIIARNSSLLLASKRAGQALPFCEAVPLPFSD